MLSKSQVQVAEEAKLHDQTNLLPKGQLIFVFCVMAISLMVCMIDQNGISVLLPDIARDLNAADSISWAGTSSLIASTVFQVLFGRLSDLFGRKNILLWVLILLGLSDLACGLSVNSTMLYIFRGLAGVGNAGITSLSMMIVSDVVTLQERGKYQGILGGMVGLGNAIGPLIAAGFAIHLTWRGFFWLLAPLCIVACLASWKFLPTNMPKLNLRETVAKIDGLGLLLGTAAIILLLIPVSSGGHSGTPWDSPEVIAMLVVGSVCLIAFLIVEWKWAKLPMMPLSMFKSPSVAAMMTQSFLLWAAYQSFLYFLPLYFQNVRGKSPIISACLQLPLVGPQSMASISGGLYMSRFNRYQELIWVGFGLFTLGIGLFVMAGRDLDFGIIAIFEICIGIGTGFTLQPTLVALQAHCPKAQRAVAVSTRNFLRSTGGAVGLAVSSAILTNVLKGSLPDHLKYVAEQSFAIPDLSSFSEADRNTIKNAYASGSRGVFIWCVPLAALAFLLTFVIKDKGLTRKEEKEAADQAANAAAVLEDPEKGVVQESVGQEQELVEAEMGPNEKKEYDRSEQASIASEAEEGVKEKS